MKSAAYKVCTAHTVKEKGGVKLAPWSVVVTRQHTVVDLKSMCLALNYIMQQPLNGYACANVDSTCPNSSPSGEEEVAPHIPPRQESQRLVMNTAPAGCKPQSSLESRECILRRHLQKMRTKYVKTTTHIFPGVLSEYKPTAARNTPHQRQAAFVAT
jgi:hypothetical protein